MNPDRLSRPSDPIVFAARRGATRIWSAAFVIAAAVVFALALVPSSSDPPTVDAAPSAPPKGVATPSNEATRLDYRIEQTPSSGSDELNIDQGSVHG
jgi:hypothetical protein